MLRYTLIMIKYKDEYLMLNREKPSWMGRWNGTGGKIKYNESPFDSAKRELFEETGIKYENPEYKGILTWVTDKNQIITDNGMYIFLAELKEKPFNGPLETREGILAWKKYLWLMDENNEGTADNIKYFIPNLSEKILMEYRCFWENNILKNVEISKLEKKWYDIKSKKQTA